MDIYTLCLHRRHRRVPVFVRGLVTVPGLCRTSRMVVCMSWGLVTEEQFRDRLHTRLVQFAACHEIQSVTGPGRSGAIAAVYASHLTGLPFIPWGMVKATAPQPVLLIDTATESCATLRKAHKRLARYGVTCHTLALFEEPPRVKFWYECWVANGAWVWKDTIRDAPDRLLLLDGEFNGPS